MNRTGSRADVITLVVDLPINDQITFQHKNLLSAGMAMGWVSRSSSNKLASDGI